MVILCLDGHHSLLWSRRYFDTGDKGLNLSSSLWSLTLCACVRVRACVCVFGSGVHLCVSVCLVRDFDLWFRFGTLHSNPGNAAEQSHCGSGRTDNKFTIFLLVAEDFSQLYLFRDTRGKRAPLVKNGRRSIFSRTDSCFVTVMMRPPPQWTESSDSRRTQLNFRSLFRTRRGWKVDREGPAVKSWRRRLKVGIDVLNTNYTAQN